MDYSKFPIVLAKSYEPISSFSSLGNGIVKEMSERGEPARSNSVIMDQGARSTDGTRDWVD